MSGLTEEWIVKQKCGHVSRWVLTPDPAEFNTPRPVTAPQPCKGEPVVGWGEWCPRCGEIVKVEEFAA